MEEESAVVVGFVDLGLRPELLTALAELGYEEPTPIQRLAIPPMLAGRDVLGQAATGTGKTAAFALPLLQAFQTDAVRDRPYALVVVPTRELAVQVAEAVRRYGRSLGVRVLAIYGGQPIGHQLRALDRGVDVVVATPGRALDHVGRGTLVLDGIKTVVLDEADEMLDMGFAEDIDALLSEAPKERQTVLFSATMPRRILDIAKRHQRDPERLSPERETVAPGEAPRVRQTAYIVPRQHKVAAVGRILDVENPTAALVFCRTRVEVDELTEALTTRGYRAEALHGGLTQERRDRVMKRLRSGTAELLVATDVAARGLDIDHLTHVINFDIPEAPDAYVHRIGRVGRAGREGVAITLAEPREHRLLKNIERATGQKFQIAKIPTVADLRARRLEVVSSSLREVLMGGDLERFRIVVESLADEFDPMDVAAAAVRLVHDAEGPQNEEEDIPEPAPRREFAPREPGPRGPRENTGPVGRVFVGIGRGQGIRPQDLVGAIVHESGLDGRDIGHIQIAERFCLVEVPEAAVDHVVQSLRRTTIRGRKPTIRADRGSPA